MPARRPPAAASPAAALRFADLHGHEQQVAFLRRAWERGRLAHAYFFSGPEGVGKLAVARALALGLHCETTPFDACGACASCRTIAAGTHPDVRVLAGPADDRRDIAIDQVRELQRELGFRSLSTGPKVGIVNDAQLLTVQAQNALLKTLEEPSGATVLVLVGLHGAALVPTILSRCQRVAFGPLPAPAVVAILRRQGWDEADAAAVAAYAEGSPGRALALDRELFGTRRRALLERLSTLRGADAAALAAFAQELATREKDLTPVLAIIASWYRDGLRRGLLGDAAPLQNADLAARLGHPDPATSLRNLETTYATIAALRQNANRNLALMDMMLRLSD